MRFVDSWRAPLCAVTNVCGTRKKLPKLTLMFWPDFALMCLTTGLKTGGKNGTDRD